MRRADRLFQIIELLRRRKVVTAQQLAERLEVSERTIYRDIRDLEMSGTPIEGEAGVGYRLRGGYDLPPLMFNREEIEALVLGARIVAAIGDPGLAAASKAVLSKVETVLPDANVRLWFRLMTGQEERRLPHIRRNAQDRMLSAMSCRARS